MKANDTDLRAEVLSLKKKLAVSNASILSILEKNRDGVLIVDAIDNIVYANPAAIDLFGKNLGELLGAPIGLPVCGDKTSEINILHPSSGKVVVEINVAKIDWEGEEAYLAALRDVTERKETEKRLEHLSNYDYLTNLPNRVLFESVLSQTIKRADRNNTHMALLYLDLDDFKKINDSLGHDCGDMLLQSVSKHLSNSLVRENDLVARLGGDEFAIILDGITNPEDATVVANKVLKLADHPITFHGKEVYSNTSIGIAVYPMAGKSTTELIKNADTAMYAAKQAGRHQYRFFTDELNSKAQRRLKLDTNLHGALENNEFYMFFQPQMSLKTGKIVGVEALLRWESAELGLVPPDEFLTVAESTGLIVEIGGWVLNKACEEFKCLNNDELTLSINLSTFQLLDSKLASSVKSAIDKYQFKSDMLILEITESLVMTHIENSLELLNKLKALGAAISIDDFGTGYSSLSYLRRLPIFELKIDREFVKDVDKDSNDQIIAKTILALAKNLNLRTVGEGAETQAHMDFLKENGCDYVQGYFVAKPMSKDELMKFLNEWDSSSHV